MTDEAIIDAAPAPTTTDRAPLRTALTKVPEATVLFWITKILTTGMGETTSDFFGHSSQVVIIVAVAGLVFIGSMILQFRVNRYIPSVYWLAVVMVSIFGTMVADGVHIGLGVSYLVSTSVLAVALAVVLGLWYRSEGTLSIHTITTRRRETYYWATVMTTFALGTAAGDMMAWTLHLGFFIPGLMFIGIIALPGLAHWKLGLNAVAAFWSAYIVTRPLGASFSDWAAVSPARDGLGFGAGPVSVVLGILIVLVLAVDRTASRKTSRTLD